MDGRVESLLRALLEMKGHEHVFAKDHGFSASNGQIPKFYVPNHNIEL